MPVGARRGIVGALLLSLAFGSPAVQAQQSSGSGWTDPPARRPASPSAPASPPSRTETPAKQVEAPSRPAPAAEAPKRTVRERTARREPAIRRRAATRDVEAVSVRRSRVAALRIRAAAPRMARRDVRGSYAVGRPVESNYGEADDRLNRLQAAADAGYIVVRRRSVEFPDGRSLRIYRPMEDGYDPY